MKNRKNQFALLACVCVSFGLGTGIASYDVQAGPVREMEAVLENAKETYAEGSEYNGSCQDKNLDSKGFVGWLYQEMFGVNSLNYSTIITPIFGSINDLCVGDIVVIAGETDHNIIVTDIVGDNVYYADEGNSDGCTIHDSHYGENTVCWNRVISKNDLDESFLFVFHKNDNYLKTLTYNNADDDYEDNYHWWDDDDEWEPSKKKYFVIVDDCLIDYLGNDKNIDVPDGVKEIGDKAFSGCDSINSIYLSSTVTRIGDSAFSNCKNLQSVSFGGNETEIGGGLFYNCPKLSWIYGLKNIEKLDCYIDNRKIEDGDKNVNVEGFFQNCTQLWSIEIPDTVTEIGPGAFWGCTRLYSVEFGGNVESIDIGAFYGCSYLRKINIPDSVKKIEDKAFAWCTRLERVAIPSGVTEVGDYIFQNCTNLIAIGVSDNILDSLYPFDGDSYIKDICYSGKNKNFSIDINENGKAVNYTVHYEHEEEVDPEIPPTFYSTGLSEGSHCSICGYVIDKQNELPEKTLGTTSVYLAQNEESGVTIKWYKVEEATGYYIYRDDKHIGTVTKGSTLKYTDKKAKNGTKYSYSVKPICNDYKGETSKKKVIVRVTTPIITSIKSTAKKQIRVAWNKNAQADGYQVKLTIGKTTKQYDVRSKNILSKLFKSLKSGKTYSISVRSYKKVSGVMYYSGWSSVSKCKVK